MAGRAILIDKRPKPTPDQYAQLGRDIGMTPQTAHRWLRVLEGTFQWFEVPAFKGDLLKRVSSEPKGYRSGSDPLCRRLSAMDRGRSRRHSVEHDLTFKAIVFSFCPTAPRGNTDRRIRLAGPHRWRGISIPSSAGPTAASPIPDT